MSDAYPYMLTNNKIDGILTKLRSAAKPGKVTYELLKQLGYSSSNDRAIIPLLKKLSFISEDGVPTEYYDRLKDHTDWKFVLGERIKDLYRDLYNIDTEIHQKSDDEIKGAIARVTGKDEASINRYFATFKALTSLAKFGSSPKTAEQTKQPVSEDKPANAKVLTADANTDRSIAFCHNIQIQLPATTDIGVYNAIFKSIRENLLGD